MRGTAPERRCHVVPGSRAARGGWRGGVAALALRLSLAVTAAFVPAHAPLAAQERPDRPERPAESESASRLAAGMRAVAAGDGVLARREFLAAVVADPSQPDAWGELVRLDADDPERRAIWILDAVAACADAQGRFTLPLTWPKVPREELAFAQKVAALRATALREVVAAAGRLQGASATAALFRLERLARDLATGDSPAALDAAFDAARLKTAANCDTVVRALVQAARANLAKDPGFALRLARTARGILQQRGQEKATPAPPDELLRSALTVIDKARERFRRDESPAHDGAAPVRRVWTLAELATVPHETVPAWNREHASWTSAAVATSPGGRYRVETPCGIETLRATLRVVEPQHARVAAWCGKDPFDGRPGLVRLCPSDADLEAEGRPFWWAGGYQGGDVTVLGVPFADGGGIANLLAHELTHRFDGALLRGLPTWAIEGRATWVAAAAQPALAETIEPRLFLTGRLWQAGAKGYGGKENLSKLLRGDVPDYRHFYDGGYALWLFLERFRGFDATQTGTPLFRAKIRGWLDQHTADPPRGDPVARFASHFADGKDGRPEGFDAFVAMFGQFVHEGGSGARPPAPWRAAWDADAAAAWQTIAKGPGGWDGPQIFDAPVWSTARSRSDPPPAGEGLALEAAELLLLAGQRAAAVEAAHLALQADEPRARTFARVAEIDAEAGDAAAGWFGNAEAERLDPAWAAGGAAGVPTAFAAAWRPVRAVLDALAAEVATADASGRRRVSFALRADHDRLAADVLAHPLGIPPGLLSGAPREPEVAVPRSLLAGTLREVRWARMETEPGGPWHLVGADTLELGRTKDADSATSGAVRDAGAKRIAVESPLRVGGTFTIRTRVRMVSAFTDAAVVVGRTTTDRGLAIRLSGGDWDYAVGYRQGTFELNGISLRIDDARGWDDRTTAAAAWVPFVPPREVFDLEVRVAGPFVRVVVSGEPVLSLRRATLAPVEGGVSFALERGIVRFEEPVVRFERALGPDRVTASGPFDEHFRLDAPSAFPWATAVGRVVEGVPRSPRGTLVLWFPEGTDAAELAGDAARAAVGQVVASATGAGIARSDIVVAIPEDAAKGDASWMVADAAAFGLDRLTVRTHRGCPPLATALAAMRETVRAGGGTARWHLSPVWIAIDPDGVIRRAGPEVHPAAAAQMFRSLAGR